MIPRKWKIRRIQVPDTFWECPDGTYNVTYKPLWYASNGKLWCESPFSFESLCKCIKELIKERPELA